MNPLRILLPLLALSLSPALASAQINLSGNISDLSGHGPLVPGVPYHVVGSVTIPLGQTLTIQPGTIIKVSPGADWFVSGTLDARGTAGNPIHFTSIFDDAIGGDSNGDGGLTSALPGDWLRLYFADSADLSELEFVEVSYAGAGNFPGVQLHAADIRLHDSTVRDCLNHGLSMGASVSGTSGAAHAASIERNTFTNNGGDAIANAYVDILPNLVDNSGTGNGGNWVSLVWDGFVDADLTVGPQNGIDGVIQGSIPLEVPAGVTWTIQAGTIMKMVYFIRGAGSLVTQGTAMDPVVFTALADDSVGGDSNGDGPSVGAPGSWQALLLSGDAHLNHTHVRYAGSGPTGSAINLIGGSPAIHDCVIEHSSGDGLRYSVLVPGAEVHRCTFRDNLDEAIVLVDAEEVPGLIDNVATGNGKDWVRVAPTGGFSSSPTWRPENGFNGALYLSTGMAITAGESLTLAEGVIVKMGAGVVITVQGEIFVEGTASSPVVLTDIRDDSHGGDTNTDGGGTVPAPGGWGQLNLVSTGGASRLEHLLARFGGSFHPLFEPGMIRADNSLVELSHLRLERSAGSGLELEDAALVHRLCITDCDQSGLRVGSTGAVLGHLTCADNGGYGVNAVSAPTFTGEVVNSISWNNSMGAYNNLEPGEVRYSNGDAILAGTGGNLFVDPLFMDAGADDYRLQFGSPCLDAGDPLSPLDPDGTPADMGYDYRDGCNPGLFCFDQDGVCPVTVDFAGTPSASSGLPFLIRAQGVPHNSFGLFFYGVGTPQTPVDTLYGKLCIGTGPLRTPVVNSGPGAGCGGELSVDFNSWIAGGSDPRLVAGTPVVGQWWYREGAAPNGAAFSPATRFAVCP